METHHVARVAEISQTLRAGRLFELIVYIFLKKQVTYFFIIRMRALCTYHFIENKSLMLGETVFMIISKVNVNMSYTNMRTLNHYT